MKKTFPNFTKPTINNTGLISMAEYLNIVALKYFSNLVFKLPVSYVSCLFFANRKQKNKTLITIKLEKIIKIGKNDSSPSKEPVVNVLIVQKTGIPIVKKQSHV